VRILESMPSSEAQWAEVHTCVTVTGESSRAGEGGLGGGAGRVVLMLHFLTG
jgi:hypothetical protein